MSGTTGKKIKLNGKKLCSEQNNTESNNKLKSVASFNYNVINKNNSLQRHNKMFISMQHFEL